MGHRPPRFWFVIALCCAVAHAVSSFYWATGGDLLLNTVGQWAFDLRADAPVFAATMLAVVGVVKLAGGVVPLLNEQGRLPWPRLWWWLSVAGSAVLILYGAANIVGAVLGLAGGDYTSDERAALIGHAFIWDPLFLIWGLTLGAGLLASRRERVSGITP